MSQAWHHAGQFFMDEWSRNPNLNRWWADASREDREEMKNSNYTWANVEGFRNQQVNSGRAVDLGRLLSPKWQEGDVVLLNWLKEPDGHDEVPDHAEIVTEASSEGRFIASETAARHHVPWNKEWKKIEEFIEEPDHHNEWPYGWTWELLRPRYRASNLG